MKGLSVTALKTFRRCPKQYYFRYNEHLYFERPEETRRFRTAKIVHQTLAGFHSETESSSWEDLDQRFVEEWERSNPVSTIESAREYHETRGRLWDSFSDISSARPEHCALHFRTDFGGGPFSGFADRIDRTENGFALIDYSMRTPNADDHWYLNVYAAALCRRLSQPVTKISIVPLGHPAVEIPLGDFASIEREVREVREVLKRTARFKSLPGEHCRRCPYLQICREGNEKVNGFIRSNELFRLFRASELLFSAGNERPSLYEAAKEAARCLDESCAIHWLSEQRLDEGMKLLLSDGHETEGTIQVEEGLLSLRTGGNYLAPLKQEAIFEFTGAIGRNTVEIFMRTLRTAYERVRNYETAAIDGLTGLKRREVFQNDLAGTYREAALVIFDVDHFKSINDTWGHDAGDDVLRAIGSLLSARDDFTAYRLGGEEFAIILPVSRPEVVFRVAEEICREISNTEIRTQNREITVTASAGYALPCLSTDTPEDLYRAADSALYDAKNAGRNRVKPDQNT